MNATLGLRRRILVLISLALLASIAAGLLMTYWHANKKVAVEMRAALASAQGFVSDALEPLPKATEPSRSLQRIVSSFDGNRHLRAFWIGPAGQQVTESHLAPPDEHAPDWFFSIFSGEPLTADVTLPRMMTDLGFIRLATDSQSEVGEVWEDLSLKMLIVLIFTALVLTLVNSALGHALRPLTSLSDALGRVGDGDYTAQVPVDGPPEFSRIYRSFNSMTSRLLDVETQNARLNEQLAKVQEEERADIARDLHDEFGPFLFSIDVDARSIQNKSRTAQLPAIGSNADAIRGSVAHLQKHLRSILGRLRPSALLDLGLKHALEHLIEFWRARRPDVQISAAISQTTYSEQIDNICFRIVQEALNNAMKHGAPDSIEIVISSTTHDVVINIVDNGGGVRSAPSHGFGLSGMRERIRAAGGSLDTGNRQDGLGFALTARLPLAGQEQVPEANRTAPASPKEIAQHEAAHH
jgi:two-component system sensor histidine kinase UhpB